MQLGAFKTLVEAHGFAAVEDGSYIYICPKDDLTVSRWRIALLGEQVSGDEAMFRRELAVLASLETGDVAAAAKLALPEDE